VAALAVGLTACLAAPPADGGEQPGPDGSGPDGGASAVKDGAPVDAAACPDAFAIAYTNRLVVDPAGGAYQQMLVIAAVGDAVDLSTLLDGGDDSAQLEVELTQPNYDPLPAGMAGGELAPAAAQLIVGPLVAPDAWTQPASPTFQLTFAPLAADAPPPHHASARLRVGDSVATLEFDLSYDRTIPEDAVATKATVATSVCGG
jgi:hypothetical protein